MRFNFVCFIIEIEYVDLIIKEEEIKKWEVVIWVVIYIFESILLNNFLNIEWNLEIG